MAQAKTQNPSRWLAMASAVAVGVALTGCAAAAEDPGTTEAVTLKMWTWSPDAQAALEKEVLPLFAAENPDVTVKVTLQPNQNYETILTTALSGSGSPDIVGVRSGILEGMAANEAIAPIGDIVTSWDGYTDSVLKRVASRADGEIYAVPQGIQTAQIYYNKTIFDDLGLEVPTTWNDFLKVSKTISEADIAPIVVPGGDIPQAALATEVMTNARRGASEFEAMFLSGDVDMTSADSVASIEIMTEIQPYLIDDVTAITLDAAVTLFTTGQAAMFPSGAWQVSTFRNLGVDIDYGTFNMPVDPSWPTAEAVQVGYVDGGWALATRSEHPEEAALLLNFLASADAAEAYANAMGALPARSGVTLEDPQLAEMLDRWDSNPSTYLGNAFLRFGTPSGTDLMGGLVQKMWLGQIDATQAAQDYQDGLDAWFDPADFAEVR